MSEEYCCMKCRKPTAAATWCESCYYPGIDEDYEDYQNMLAEGFREADAAVGSGWKGAEEI